MNNLSKNIQKYTNMIKIQRFTKQQRDKNKHGKTRLGSGKGTRYKEKMIEMCSIRNNEKCIKKL
jgi:ribosomal protein L16/L10AE